MDETALVTAAQKGSPEAFHRLFEENKKRIYALAYQYTRNVEDTQDIFQDIFFKAFKYIGKFNTENSSGFSSWLYRIGINCCIDFVRKHRTRRQYSAEVEDMENLSRTDPSLNPEDSRRHSELLEEAQNILNGITPRQRMVFILRHYQQLSVAEIAEIMKCSEGSVKKQLFRAVSTFKERLKPFYMEESYGL